MKKTVLFSRLVSLLSILILCSIATTVISCRNGAVRRPMRRAPVSQSNKEEMAFRNPNLPLGVRVADLISRMTLEEKVSQMLYNSPAIERLGIPEYNWWNECLHGVARAGRATVFPQAIGLAATFDEDLMYRVSTAISDEARAMHHAAVRDGRRLQYGGLTFWTPNINIFRDPRWGRGQETYGEDPFLTGTMGTAFVRGLQGDNPRYLKAAACAKHYVVHSGPEVDRHRFNAVVSPKDLYETYLPAFKALVDADVEAIMCAYNRTNGEPCCGSKSLLGKILRDEWGFDGHIVSDCWALSDLHMFHKVTSSPVESAALAINSGVNLNCGVTFSYLDEAVREGLVTEDTINESLTILLRTRFKLGMFDPPEMNPYTSIPTSVIRCEKHQQLAREAAAKSVVMLKNDNVLPLNKDAGFIFVTGPCAADTEVLLGNYHGVSDGMVTILEGITVKRQPGSFIQYRQGFLLRQDNQNQVDRIPSAVRQADAIIVVMGISPLIEGEEGSALESDYEGDRRDIGLPENQLRFLKSLREGNDQPIIVVLTGGSPLAIPEVHELADAILYVWYPGEQGGNGVADVIFGDVAPSGRLPITFPKSTDQLPPYEDYNMKGRTYRYMTEEPLYPFGFGLSYMHFEYSDLRLGSMEIEKGDDQIALVNVRNIGDRRAEEVVQLYITDLNADVETPNYSLKGFKRVDFRPGQRKTVSFKITPEMMSIVNEQGRTVLEPGKVMVSIGGCCPGDRGIALGATEPVKMVFNVR
jgi:beta-glucosidase